MDFLTFGVVYLSGAAFLLFTMLFGESPMFVGTPVGKLHWLLTEGTCDGLQWVVRKTCGQRGEQALDNVCERFCDRPNPFLQISYVCIIGAVYAMYLTQLFPLLPNPVVSTVHIYLGTGLCMLCLTVFLIASRSDPGTVTQENLDMHLSTYPFDEVIWTSKECWTCKQIRPARSKHCGVCGRCVARFDHHCAWINNCVGLGNHRLFLLFLLSTTLLCMYGLVLAACILWGEVLRYNLLQQVFLDRETGRVVRVADNPRRIITWLVVHYSLPMTACLFIMVATLLMSCFFGYQMYLVFCGRTTYETFKWREVYQNMVNDYNKQQPTASWMQKVWRVICCCFVGPAIQMPANSYDNGPLANMFEVLSQGRSIQQRSMPQEQPEAHADTTNPRIQHRLKSKRT